MKKLSDRIIFSALFLFLLVPLFIYANDVVEIENPITATSVEAVINNVVKFVWRLALILAPLMIIIGAFYLITAAGDPEKIKIGKKIITWAIVGIVVVLLSTGVKSIIEEILSHG